MKSGIVQSLSLSGTHSMCKYVKNSITLLEGLGVEGDAHMGKTVKHRSRVAKDPTQPNLRQVHLIHQELFDELQTKGFDIAPGQMGENIITSGIHLLQLPKGTILTIGQTAAIEITGLRNPCHQLDGIQKGLMKAVLDRDKAGNLIRKAGIMGIVKTAGDIHIGDTIIITYPEPPFEALDRV